MFNATDETKYWLRRPLCKRYAVVVFNATSRLQIGDGVVPNRTIGWALGTLLNGDREILDAWKSNDEGAIPAKVFGHLYDRGVEFITYASGDLAASRSAFTAAYPRAVQLPSLEQSLAVALGSVRPAHRPAVSGLLRASADPTEAMTAELHGNSRADWRERYPGMLERWDEAVAAFQPVLTLPEPYRELVRSVDRTAIEVQKRLLRAIHRHDLFVDADEAFEFVAAALHRADRRLGREREAWRHARAACASRSGSVMPASGRALGTPTLA